MRFLINLKYKPKAILILIGFLWLNSVFGTHIVGGELTYQFKGGTTYEIRLDIYIDCENGSSGAISQDATGYISFYDGNSGSYLQSLTNQFNSGSTTNIGQGVSRSGPSRLIKLNYNCIRNAPNACVDHYWYIRQVSLPARTGGYIVSFQRCCRNNSITNLNFPESTGAVYWTSIPNPSETPNSKANSSAVFKERPPNFLCTNAPLRFDHSATDADGDSLVYEFFQPYDGANTSDPRPDNTSMNGFFEEPPFRQISWASGYTTGNPINGNPQIAIDRKTGYLTLTPTKIGQFVVGIRVLEYRKGKLIAETKRDYQFNVQNCIVDVVASYYNPLFICDYKYQFQNFSTGADRYFWDFGITTKTNDTSNLSAPSYTFPGPGKYTVKLIAYKGNCIDSFSQIIEAVSPVKPKLQNDSLVCVGKSVTLSINVAGYINTWSTGASGNTITVNKNGLYWVESTYKTCKGRDSFNLKVDTIIADLPKDTFICSNSALNYTVSSKGNFAKYTWNTGATTPTILVTSPGKYLVSVATSNGCLSKDSMSIIKYPELKVVLRDTTVCKNQQVTYDAGNPGCFYLWSNNATTQTTTYSNPGNVWVVVTRNVCVTRADVKLNNYPDEIPGLKNLKFCDLLDTTVTFVGKGFKTVTWNGVPGESYRITTPGTVNVNITNSNGCPETGSFTVNLFNKPNLNLMADTTVCLSVNPVLFAGLGMQSYKWNDGSTGPSVIAENPGLYWVEIKDVNGCRNRDSVMINKNGYIFPSMVYMPTAFTPDGNGVNDLYPNNKYVNIGSLYNVKLYNRWGEKMAEFNNANLNWDGTFNGKEAPSGVYVYLVTWIGCDNQRHAMRGDFTLFR